MEENGETVDFSGRSPKHLFGDEHNLSKHLNRQDLSIRMNQYFDYFLKDAPEPEWMKKGLPAVVKGKELRYGE